MPLIFPSSPTVGQTYQSGSSGTFVYNGEAWDSQNSNLPITVTSASFALTTTRPQYISAYKSAAQNTVGVDTDITFDTVEASNGLTLSSNSVALTGGKVYQVTAAFSGITFSNGSSGFLTIQLVNSSNVLVSQVQAVITVPAVGNQWNTPVLTSIYAPATNTTVKFRSTAANGTATVRDKMSHFTITEIL